MKKYRFIACLLILILTAGTLPFLCSCRDDMEKVLFRVGEYPVTVEEYRYFYLNYQAKLTSGGVPAQEEIHAQVLEALRHKYAMQKKAEDYGIVLSEEELAAVESEYQSYVNHYGGEDSFRAALEAQYLTDRYFRAGLCSAKLEEKVQAYAVSYLGGILATDDIVREDIQTNFFRASQILLLHEAGDSLVANYQQAQALRQRAADGEDFESLVRTYNEDTYMDAHDGYYFTRGERLQAFEDAVISLKEGEISPVLKTELGYHVVKRLPLEEDYITSHFETFRTAYRNRVFTEEIKAIGDGFEITYYDRFTEWSPS